jgi:hypothetical protein
MKVTHCYDLAVEVGAGLAAINDSKKMHADIRYTFSGIELLVPYKGLDYIVHIYPKGELNESIRVNETSTSAA